MQQQYKMAMVVRIDCKGQQPVRCNFWWGSDRQDGSTGNWRVGAAAIRGLVKVIVVESQGGGQEKQHESRGTSRETRDEGWSKLSGRKKVG